MTAKDTKKTVLHVIDTTGPGGAETVFLDLAEEGMRRGFRSVALIRGPGWVEEQLRERGIPYYVRDCKGSLNLKFLFQMARIVRRERVTQIQSHLLGSNVYTSLVGLLLRIPVVATFHGHVDISKKERFRNVKLGIIRVGASHVVCVTEDLKQTVSQSTSGWSRLSPVVIPNGINTAVLEDLTPKRLPSPPGKIVFGCLGNVRPAKNYALAIDFMAHLRDLDVTARLLIAGDDAKPEGQQLKAKVERLGLSEQITFLGFIENVPKFFESIDVFLMTSNSEGHPLALTQALAAGKPVVTTASGVEKVIPESLMFLANAHSPGALAQACRRLQETQELDTLLDKGRSYVRELYSLEAMFARYLQLYRA